MIYRKSITFSALIVVILLATGCAEKNVAVATRGAAFPNIYSEQPRSILVLPPINKSTTPEATTYYMATIEMPLTSRGYDVLPAESVTDILRQNGIYDTNLLYTMPLDTLYKYFGSDAVLYTRINQWEEAHTGLISRLIISIEAEIVSTKTSTQLWVYNSSVNVDLNTVKTTGGSIQLIIDAMTTDVDKATADSIAYTLRATTKLTRDLPFGPQHEDYLQDQPVKLIGHLPPENNSK